MSGLEKVPYTVNGLNIFKSILVFLKNFCKIISHFFLFLHMYLEV